MDDILLAIAHHVLVFGLALILATQLALVRPGWSAADLRRVGAVDLGYGVTAGLIVLVGVLRVRYGAKGVDWYHENLWFWAKMGTFAAVGLLSIPPTIAFIRWRRALRKDPAAMPSARAIARIRNFVRLEVALLLLVPVFAALMARYQG
jgi:putative membrane protein